MPSKTTSARVTKRASAALLCLLAAAANPRNARAQRPLNLDFEREGVAYPSRPWGYQFGWTACRPGAPVHCTLDDSVAARGSRSLRLRAVDGRSVAAEPVRLDVPAAMLGGRTLRWTARVRTSDGATGVLLTLTAAGDRRVLATDSTMALPAVAAAWTEQVLSVRIPVATDLHTVWLDLALRGPGTAWIDDMSLSVDGQPILATPTPSAPSEESFAWLARRAAPLARAEPSAGLPGAPPAPAGSIAANDDDLAAFRRGMRGARIIGLGESTHGTSEFFLLKHRLLRLIAEQEGPLTFGVEANAIGARALDAYVMGGAGDARTAMRQAGLYAVWTTEEFRAMVEWIREHNRRVPSRAVRVVGIDMQDHATPADSLASFVARIDPAFLPRVRALSAGYRASPSWYTPANAESERRQWAAQADTLADEVEARRATWLGTADDREDSLAVEWAVHAAGLFQQSARANAAQDVATRDSLMAANVAWAVTRLHPGLRMVLWAHDVHVSRGGDPVRSFYAGATMGAHLRRRFGVGYRAVALLTANGTYRATRDFADHRMMEVPLFPPPEGSVEAILDRLPRPSGTIGLFLELPPDEQDRQGAPLWSLRPVRSIGYSAFDYGFEQSRAIALEFDALFFVARSNASRALARSP